jgi:DNA transposition AAA+ family ATPase
MAETAVDHEHAETVINPEYAEAIEQLKLYKEQSGRKQEDIGRELGISSSYMSQFMGGTYKSPHTLIPKVRQLVKIFEERRTRPTEPPFAATAISRAVMSIITYCHLQGKLGVAYGDAGTGKTVACREYCKRNIDAIMITADPCYASVAGVAELLARKIGIKERVSRRIYEEIASKLAGTMRVIIVDEAQHLTVKAIDQLRSINDACGVGVALIGNEAVYTKMRDGTAAELAQLYSRIGSRARIQTSQIGIDDIFAVFAKANLEKEAADVLHRISRTNYGLRGAVNVYINAINGFQISDNSGITAPRLARAAKEMGIA